MTMTTTALRMAFLAAAGAAACAWAPQAAADDTVQADLGGQADVGGGQQWTVTALQPSADVIGYQPAGALWEATATATPAGGGVPVVPGFTARSGGGDSYPVLWTVPTPAGVNPRPCLPAHRRLAACTSMSLDPPPTGWPTPATARTPRSGCNRRQPPGRPGPRAPSATPRRRRRRAPRRVPRRCPRRSRRRRRSLQARRPSQQRRRPRRAPEPRCRCLLAVPELRRPPQPAAPELHFPRRAAPEPRRPPVRPPHHRRQRRPRPRRPLRSRRALPPPRHRPQRRAP